MKKIKSKVHIPAVAVGIVVGLLLVLLLSMLFGMLMVKNVLPESMAGAASIVAMVIGTAAAVLYSTAKRKEKKLMMGMVAGAGMLILMFIVHSIGFRGTDYQFILPLASVLGTALAMSMVVTLQKKKHRY